MTWYYQNYNTYDLILLLPICILILYSNFNLYQPYITRTISHTDLILSEELPILTVYYPNDRIIISSSPGRGKMWRCRISIKSRRTHFTTGGQMEGRSGYRRVRSCCWTKLLKILHFKELVSHMFDMICSDAQCILHVLWSAFVYSQNLYWGQICQLSKAAQACLQNHLGY
jgi:hypothetical protein